MSLITTLKQEARKLSASIDAHPIARRLHEGTPTLPEYGGFLTQTYHYVRWTGPLLALAAERMKHLGQDPELASLLAHKAHEEAGHELWALNDGIALGLSREAIVEASASPAVESYVAWNRFITRSDTPIAFLGTAYVLESLSLDRGAATVRNLRARCTLPGIQNALSFLERHATADELHLEQLTQKLARLRRPHERERTALSARITRHLYLGLFASSAVREGARSQHGR